MCLAILNMKESTELEAVSVGWVLNDDQEIVLVCEEKGK